MGWVALAGIGVVIAVALVALGVPRLVWTSAGAALMLAATGYAVQGRPDLPGHPATPTVDAVSIAPEEFELRDQMFGAYHNGTAYLGAADALIRIGEPRTAARAALGGTQAHPGNAALWTELGLALSASDGGTVSPAAALAFNHAMAIAPAHPAPHYFLGLAELTAGRPLVARAQWVAALQLTPPNAGYRGKLIERLQALDQAMMMRGGTPPPASR